MEDFRPLRALPEQQGNHEVVTDHDGERDGFNNNHCCGSGQSSDEGYHGKDAALGAYRQGEHKRVAIGTCRKQDKTGNGDGNHKNIDGNEIERKQPGSTADVGGGGVFDNGHVELPGQEDNCTRCKKGQRQPTGAVQSLGKQRENVLVR